MASIDDLIRKSKNRIEKSLEKGFVYHHLAMERSETFLRKHDSERILMFVLYADLVGSTKMSSELEPAIFNTIIRMFSQEMAFVIEQFDGFVLKFVGDAVLGYFIENSKIGAKKVIQCTYAMNEIVKNAINPILKSKSFPELKIKTTVDYGFCSIVRYGTDKKKSHIDLIGLTLNLAAKMQQLAKPNQIIIGEFVFNKLNGKEKSNFSKVKTDYKSWRFHEQDIQKIYSVYSVKKSLYESWA